MLFWSKARTVDFEGTAMQAYNIMQALMEYGEELCPVYLTVSKKQDIAPFNWSYDSFVEILKKGVNKEGKNETSELGYSVNFFSSLIEKNSASISMTVGGTNPKFKNTLIISLPQSFSLYNDSSSLDKLEAVFRKCAALFNPDWAAIVNKVNSRRYNGYFNGDIPSTIHWLNYWGIDIIDRLEKRNLEQAPILLKEKLNDGYLLKLKRTPINDLVQEDIEIQCKANNNLGL